MKNKEIRVIVNGLGEGGFQSVSLNSVSNFKDYYKLIGNDCRAFDIVYVEYKGHRLSVFVDDEGMLKSGNLGRMVGNYPQPIFGNVVITGDVDSRGNTLGVPDELGVIDFFEMFGEVKWQVK